MNDEGSIPAAVVKHAADLTFQEVKGGRATGKQVLIGAGDGAPNFSMRRFVMTEEGAGMSRHTNEVEHEQYVLRGRARVTIGDTAYDVSADDALFIPAGAPHSYHVLEEPFEFICVVPNRPDTIELVDDAE